MLSSAQVAQAAELVGLYSRSFSPEKATGLSASRRYVSTEAGVYSSLDARATVRVSRARDLLTRPACGRPNARTRRLNHPRHVVSLHAPSRRRRACGDHATSRPATGARGTNAKRVRCARRADAAARETSNPVRRGARLAETAIARETAARRRRGGPGSLSLSLSLSPLSVDRRDEAPSSSSKRSARVQLCWDITPGAAAAAAAATYIQRITVPAFPAAS